ITMPTVSSPTPSPEGISVRAGQAVAELSRLLDADLAPADFHAAFLQHALATMQGVAGAIWTRTPHDNFQLEHQLNLATVGLDLIPNGRASHGAILKRVARANRPILVPPRR